MVGGERDATASSRDLVARGAQDPDDLRGAILKDEQPLIRADDGEVLERIVSAVIAAQIVTVNTLHAQGIVNRAQFARAYARVIEQLGEASLSDPLLADREYNRLLVVILTILKNSLTIPGDKVSFEASEWLGGALHSHRGDADKSVN